MSISTFSKVYPTCFGTEKQPLITPSAASAIECGDPVDRNSTGSVSSIGSDPVNRLNAKPASLNAVPSLLGRFISTHKGKIMGTVVFLVNTAAISTFLIIGILSFPPLAFGMLAMLLCCSIPLVATTAYVVSRCFFDVDAIRNA